MKKLIEINYLTGFMLVALMAFSSCENWLDVKPSNQTEASALFSSEKGFQEALSGVYTTLSSEKLYGRELTFGLVDVLGQRWGSMSYSNATYYHIQRYNYEYAAVITIIDDIWNQQFYAISQVNNMLQYVDEKKGVFASTANYQMVKGELLGLRAYLHFDLLRLFAPYTSDEKWLPYVDEFTRNTSVSLTNQQFLEKLNADIKNAAELLKNDDLVTGRVNSDVYYQNRQYHLNYYAVRGLQARIALYSGDRSTASTAAKEIIDAQKNKGLFRFVTQNEATVSTSAHRDRTFSSEHLFALNVRKMKDYIKGYFTSVGSVYVFLPRVAPGTLYQGYSDYRAQFYETESGTDNVPSKLWQLDKVSGVSVEQKKERIPLIRISEMYYIAAETASSVSTATEYLNEVRRHRGIEVDLTGLEQQSLESEILREYDKEFVCEGQVFYYHKRKNSSKISTQSVAPKYVLPIPQTEIEFGGREDFYSNK